MTNDEYEQRYAEALADIRAETIGNQIEHMTATPQRARRSYGVAAGWAGVHRYHGSQLQELDQQF
jgi:hypothetical protein